MQEFKFIPDSETNLTPSDDVSGFSFTPDEVQPDLSKIKEDSLRSADGSNIRSKDSMDLVIDWAKNVLDPKTAVGMGMRVAERVQPAIDFVKNQEIESLTEALSIAGDVLPEAARGAAREFAVNTPKIASNILRMVGTNVKSAKGDGFVSTGINALADAFGTVSEYMGDIEVLKPDQSVMEGSFAENPSWKRFGNVIGGGAGQALTMGGLSRIGGHKLAYGFYALAGGAEVFQESYEKDKDVGKANTLAALTAASTYMIDRWIDPLPDNIAKGAKLTSKQVIKEMAKAPIKEVPAETLQQVYSENLVRKIGVDATQDLYEGLVESAIGALGGAGTMATVSGTVYAADRAFNMAKERALESGATEEDISAFERATMAKLEKHPEAFETVFQQNVQQTINDITKFAEENGNPAEVRKAMQTKADLEEVYNKVFDVLKTKENEKVASAQAKIIQGVALWGSQELGISPIEYMNERFPNIEKVAYKDFMRSVRERNDGGLGSLRQDINRLKRGVSAKSKDTRKSLSDFIKDQGGIRDDRGDIKIMEAKGLLNENGVAIDEMTRLAWDAGYLQGETRPEINQLLEALDRDVRGNKVYSINDEVSDVEANRRYYANLSEAIDRAGGDINIDDAETIFAKLKAYEESLGIEETPTLPNEDLGDFINFQAGYNKNFNPEEYFSRDDVKNNIEKSKKNFSSEMDGILDGTIDSQRKPIVLFHPTEIWLRVGLPDRKISFDQSKIKKVMREHNLTSEDLKSLPEQLANPEYIFESKTDNAAYVGVLNKNKEPLVAIVKPVGKGLKVTNIIKSAYNKDSGFVNREIEEGRLLYDKMKPMEIRQHRASIAQAFIPSGTLNISPNRENVNRTFYQESLDVAKVNAELDKVNPAYEGETININGVERTVYNSKGDRIAMSEPALRNFYKWFGDSKVVDGQGRPLVVYHGSPATDIQVFDKSKIGLRDYGYFGKGFYFTPNSEMASFYYTDNYDGADYDSGKVYPVYLNLKNPKYARSIDEGTIDTEELKEQGYDGVIVYSFNEYSESVRESDPYVKQEIEEAKNFTNEWWQLKNYEDEVIGKKIIDEIVAFEPNQIKSTSNRGTYSESDNIYYQPAFHGTPHPELEGGSFKLEKIGTGENAQAHGYGLYYTASYDVADKRYRERLTKPYTWFISFGEVEYDKKSGKYKNAFNETTLEFEVYKDFKLDAGEDIDVLLKSYEQTRFLDDRTDEKIAIVNKYKDYFVNNDVHSFSDESMAKGQVYEVDLPENPYLLDEQKSFREQSLYVKKQLRKAFKDIGQNLTEVMKTGYVKGNPTGGQLYGELMSFLGGSDRKASEHLEKYGIKGITYDGRQDGRCFVIFNPDDVKVIQKFYQDGAETLYRDPKGAYTHRINEKSLISLFERADASTFMHETAHFFFEELKTFAKTSEKSAQMLATINDWLGSDGTEYTNEQVEMFARGFEQYLREGKAPSKYLKRAFNAFVSWLRQLYKTATELNVKLNDEVRDVYANILGGQELDKYVDAPLDEILGNSKKYFAAKRAAMDEIYKENSEAKAKERKIFNRSVQTMQKTIDGMREYLADAIVPLEEEIKQISPDLYNMNRRLEISKLQKTKKYYERVKGFVGKAQKMTPVDFHTLDLALKNRDTARASALMQKYEMESDFAEVRNTLDELREQMIEVGVDVAYLPDYYPRVIKDADGLLDYVELTFNGRPEYSIIQKMIEEKSKDGRIRTKEDEAQIVNSLIRGFAGGISLAKIGNVKERSIQIIDQNMNKYYKSSIDALTSYISGSVQMVENKKYFGRETKEVQNLRRMVANRETTIAEYKAMDPKEAKWKEIKTRNYKIGGVDAQIRNTFDNALKAELQERKTKLEAEVEFLQRRRAEQVKEIAINRMQVELDKVKKEVNALADSTVENSVGNLLLELAEQGKISHNQELRLKELLIARFSNKGLGNEFLRIIRDGGYVWTLGNFESAITQFGDLGTSAYKNGLWNTFLEYGKAWTGKSEITIDDLGLGKVLQDGGYVDTSALSQALDKVLKYVGFEKMDKIAKQTLVNSAIRKARDDAKADKPELEEYLRHEFGEKWIDVKEDLKTGAITDEIIEYAMFNLMDVQPITIDQMPRYYAEGGKKRLFYMMKSYFIKQLNEYRKVCFETAKKDPKKALTDMLLLTVYLMAFNAGADLLKDLIFGRAINITDTLVNNIFIGGSINRYQAMSVKREGLFKTLQKQLLFPVMMDEVIVDVLSDKDVKNWNTWKNVPLVGRPYYWWFGGGHLKTEKEIKKQRNQRRKQRQRKRRED